MPREFRPKHDKGFKLDPAMTKKLQEIEDDLRSHNSSYIKNTGSTIEYDEEHEDGPRRNRFDPFRNYNFVTFRQQKLMEEDYQILTADHPDAST